MPRIVRYRSFLGSMHLSPYQAFGGHALARKKDAGVRYSIYTAGVSLAVSVLILGSPLLCRACILSSAAERLSLGATYFA